MRRLETSPFLFIDAKSLQTSSETRQAAARHAINCHVQRWRVERARRKRNHDLQRDTRKTCEALGLPQSSRPTSVTNNSYFQDIESDDTGERTASVEAVPDIPTGDAQEMILVRHTRPPSLRSLNINSFAGAEVQVDTWTGRSFQYFTWTWKVFACDGRVNGSFCLRPANMPSKGPPNAISRPRDIIRNCLYSEMHKYALLASCAARMKYVTMNRLERYDSAESYAVKAIFSLRKYLKLHPKIDQHVIVDVFFLCTYEYYANKYQSAKIYLHIIASMVESLGGFRHIDEYVRRLCWMGDISVAFETDSAPILPLAWEPPTLPRESLDGRAVDAKWASPSAPGNELLNLDHHLGSQLGQITADLVSCAQVIQSVVSANRAIDRQMMFEQGIAILHRLLLLQSPPANAPLSALKQECVRRALIIWDFAIVIRGAGNSASAINVSNTKTVRPTMAQRLKRALCDAESVSSSCWDTERELLLWITGLGSSVAGPERKWFAERFARLSKALEIRSFEQLSKSFSKYLYLECFESSHLIRLAGLLVQGRGAEALARF